MLKYARKIQCFEHNSRSSHLWSFIFSSTCSLPHNFISSLLLRLDKWISFRFRTECVAYELGCMLLPLHIHSQYSRIFFFCCCSINGFICLERSSRFECIIFIQSKLIKTMAGLLVHFQSGNGCQSACDILSKQ